MMMTVESGCTVVFMIRLKCDPRILAATASVGMPLVVSFWFQRNAESLDSAGIVRLIKQNPRDANARIVALRNKPRKQVEPAIRIPPDFSS